MATPDSQNSNGGHRRIWSAVGTILVAMALLLSIVMWSWTRADAATKAAAEAEKAAVRVETALPYIEEGLRDIKKELAVQRGLLTDLVRDRHE